MKKFKFLPAVLGLVVLGLVLAVIAAQNVPRELAAQSKPGGPQYQVLSPWGEADPIPLRGLTAPRVDSLNGKKIGLFVNYKRAAMPSAEAVEKQLRTKVSNAEYSYYHTRDWNVNVIETKDSEKFAAWVKSVDVIIATIGD